MLRAHARASCVHPFVPDQPRKGPRDRTGTGFQSRPSLQRRDTSALVNRRPPVRSRSAPPVHRATRAKLSPWHLRAKWRQGPDRDQLRTGVRLVAHVLRAAFRASARCDARTEVHGGPVGTIVLIGKRQTVRTENQGSSALITVSLREGQGIGLVSRASRQPVLQVRIISRLRWSISTLTTSLG
jgi:hypothetical protein